MTPGVLCLGWPWEGAPWLTKKPWKGRPAPSGHTPAHGSYFCGLPAAQPGKLRATSLLIWCQGPLSPVDFTFCTTSSSFPSFCLQGLQCLWPHVL